QRHADALLHKALDAVDRLTQVSPERLSVVSAQMTDDGRQRLKDALELCRGFLEEGRDEPAARQEAGRTYTRMAMLHLLLGQSAEALQPISKAVAIHQELVRAFPHNSEFEYNLARSQLVQGHVGLVAGQTKEAVA